MMALLPAPFELVDLGTVASTNDEATRLAGQGAPAWTVVRAIEQSAGRGRRGRSFASPPGNSYTSFVLRPDASAPRTAQIALVAGLAVAEAIDTIAPGLPKPLCKWPNDVLVSGAKVAGILVEAATRAERVEHVVVGIGVNLVTHPEITGQRIADLAALGAPRVSRDALLSCLAPRLKQWVEIWQSEGFEPVRPVWLGRAAGLGAPARVEDGGSVVHGRFAGLDADGTLLLCSDDRSCHHVVSGSLFLEDAA